MVFNVRWLRSCALRNLGPPPSNPAAVEVVSCLCLCQPRKTRSPTSFWRPLEWKKIDVLGYPTTLTGCYLQASRSFSSHVNPFTSKAAVSINFWLMASTSYQALDYYLPGGVLKEEITPSGRMWFSLSPHSSEPRPRRPVHASHHGETS